MAVLTLSMLTNFRDEQGPHEGVKSRGFANKSFLVSRQSPQEFRDWLYHTQGDVCEATGEPSLREFGGFTMLYGKIDQARLARGEPQEIFALSNRQVYTGSQPRAFPDASDDDKHVFTCSLSNTHYQDPWPKTTMAKQQLIRLISQTGLSEQALIDKCFAILDLDNTHGVRDVTVLRDTIHVPIINYNGKLYGTRQQTVILVDRRGRVVYHEKTISADGPPTTKVETFDLDTNGDARGKAPRRGHAGPVSRSHLEQ